MSTKALAPRKNSKSPGKKVKTNPVTPEPLNLESRILI